MSTPRPHEQIEELIAAEALGGLDREGRSELAGLLAEHGPDCAECIRLTNEYNEVAGRLGLAVDPISISPEAEEALLAAAREDDAVAVPYRPRPSRVRRWIALAAAAVLVALTAGVVGYSLSPGLEDRQSRFIAFASRPGTEVVPFDTPEGQQLAVAIDPETRTGWVFGTNLPDPQGDRVYELWFSAGDSEGVEPAGTFVPEDGVILAPVVVGETVDLLAVSVEPAGGSPQPTTDPILVAEA